MKIKVTPEGREGVYLISKEEATRIVKELKFETIHHQYQGSGMAIGADHEKESVLDDIAKSDRMAILIEPNFTMGHQLVVIINNERNAFDIGTITEKNLEIVEK